MKKIPLRTKITLTIAGLGQSRPGLGRNNENTRKTKSQISGYILRSAAGLLLFSCVIVALSSAIAAGLAKGENMATAVRNAKPQDKTYTLGDGDGCTWRSRQRVQDSGGWPTSSRTASKTG